MRPVLAKLVFLRELKDGTYSLADIALLNDALDVEEENKIRVHEATKED